MSKAIIAALGAALIALGTSGVVWSGHDDHHELGERHQGSGRGGLAPVSNEVYRTECGGCHFAYPPGLMTSDSWGTVMNTLDQHFGDDASLDPAVKTELLAFLQANAADRSNAKRARSFAAGKLTGDGPPRITENTYFQRKHDEVPVRYVKDNPQVKSFSHCAACHRSAERGVFDEHDVDIPGYGRFAD